MRINGAGFLQAFVTPQQPGINALQGKFPSATARAAAAEEERAADALARAEATLETQQETLADLAQRLEIAEVEPESSEEALAAAMTVRDASAQEATAARAKETEARLALRTSEERARALAGRAQSLTRAAAAEREGSELRSTTGSPVVSSLGALPSRSRFSGSGRSRPSQDTIGQPVASCPRCFTEPRTASTTTGTPAAADS